MKLCQFLESWRIVQAENRLHRIVLLGLIVTNGLSALAALRTERAVVLVPPSLDKEVEITRNTASSELKESWGLYLAELLGNVTPTNADFIGKGPDRRQFAEGDALIWRTGLLDDGHRG